MKQKSIIALRWSGDERKQTDVGELAKRVNSTQHGRKARNKEFGPK